MWLQEERENLPITRSFQTRHTSPEVLPAAPPALSPARPHRVVQSLVLGKPLAARSLWSFSPSCLLLGSKTLGNNGGLEKKSSRFCFLSKGHKDFMCRIGGCDLCRLCLFEFLPHPRPWFSSSSSCLCTPCPCPSPPATGGVGWEETVAQKGKRIYPLHIFTMSLKRPK